MRFAEIRRDSPRFAEIRRDSPRFAWAAGNAISIVGSASARRSKSSVSGAHDVT